MKNLESNKQRGWICGLLISAGLLSVVGSFAPWAALSLPRGGHISWNGFGGDFDEVSSGGVVWRSHGLEGAGYVMMVLGLAYLGLGALRLGTRFSLPAPIQRRLTLILGALGSIASVSLFLAMAFWTMGTKLGGYPEYTPSLTPSVGYGIWALLLGSGAAVAGGIIGAKRNPEIRPSGTVDSDKVGRNSTSEADPIGSITIVQCPGCRTRAKIQASYIDTSIVCKKCGTRFKAKAAGGKSASDHISEAGTA